jgi:hypothetical protein
MGDNVNDQSQFNNAYQKAFHNRLSQDANPVPPAVPSGDGSLPSAASPAPAAQGNQEDPQRVLNNRGSVYSAPQSYEDPNETARRNRALWAQSDGAPAFYSQNVDFNRATIAGKFDRNVPLGGNPLLGIHVDTYDSGGPSNTYQRVEEASKVNQPDHLLLDTCAGAPAAALSLVRPTMLTGQVDYTAGIKGRIGSAGSKFMMVGGLSEAANRLEDYARSQKEVQVGNQTINLRNIHSTGTERSIEGVLAWLCLVELPQIVPKFIKNPLVKLATLIGFYGYNRYENITQKQESEQLDLLNKAKNDLKADYINRSSRSMRNAIGSFVDYAIHQYTNPADPTHTVHEENSIGNLKALAENWDNVGGDLYQPGQKLEKLRGGIIVKTALADTLMNRPVVVAPDRDPNKPNDYLDFGCAAMKSLFNAKNDLQKCVDLTQGGNGQVSDGTVVDAAKEVADLREVEKKEIDRRIKLIQFGQTDPSGKVIGHNIVSAFNELADKDAVDSRLVSIVSGKNTSLVQTMQNEALANKNTDDPYTQIVTSKQFRDLALWQLANLDGNGTANIGHFNTPEAAQGAVNLYHFALYDFLYNAKNLCPNVADNTSQASGSNNYQQLNPDLANIEYVARVLAGKESAHSGDEQLQATANKVAASGIQAKLAVEYDGYVAHCNGSDQASVESGAINPARPGEPTGNLVPQGDARQMQVEQTPAEHQQQLADDAAQKRVDDQFREQARASQAAQASAASQQAAASRQNYLDQQAAGQYQGGQAGQYPAGQYQGGQSSDY